VSVTLADANVLIALLGADHVHHQPARAWFAGLTEPMAICPVTQGALVRAWVREQQSATVVQSVLTSLAAHPKVMFWSDDLSYEHADLSAVRGHRQVTDAYLAGLAASRQARLATFDKALAATYPKVATLLS
jgi:uncharacterized protein